MKYVQVASGGFVGGLVGGGIFVNAGGNYTMSIENNLIGGTWNGDYIGGVIGYRNADTSRDIGD